MSRKNCTIGKKIKDREIVVSKKDNIITGPTEENKIDHNIIHETKKRKLETENYTKNNTIKKLVVVLF